MHPVPHRWHRLARLRKYYTETRRPQDSATARLTRLIFVNARSNREISFAWSRIVCSHFTVTWRADDSELRSLHVRPKCESGQTISRDSIESIGRHVQKVDTSTSAQVWVAVIPPTDPRIATFLLLSSEELHVKRASYEKKIRATI